METATTVLASRADPTATPRAARDRLGHDRPSRRRRSPTDHCVAEIPRRCVAIPTSLLGVHYWFSGP
jgi:hypothetical protein